MAMAEANKINFRQKKNNAHKSKKKTFWEC